MITAEQLAVLMRSDVAHAVPYELNRMVSATMAP
jgi:hypothetical protein